MGPFGKSHGLSKIEGGEIVLIAGGTGLHPFLDLLDFLLRKTMFDLIRESKGQATAMELNKA
jgi:NAD(P)H-flavin reductase